MDLGIEKLGLLDGESDGETTAPKVSSVCLLYSTEWVGDMITYGWKRRPVPLYSWIEEAGLTNYGKRSPRGNSSGHEHPERKHCRGFLHTGQHLYLGGKDFSPFPWVWCSGRCYSHFKGEKHRFTQKFKYSELPLFHTFHISMFIIPGFRKSVQ